MRCGEVRWGAVGEVRVRVRVRVGVGVRVTCMNLLFGSRRKAFMFLMRLPSW